MSYKVTSPYQHYLNAIGEPLEAGKIYIGTAGLDAITNQIDVFWDEPQTNAASQPIRTVAGVASNNGTPSNIYVGGNYSVTVTDKNDVVVYSQLSVVAVDTNTVSPAQLADEIANISLDFIDLGDTPTDYSGAAGKALVVDAGGGIVFGTLTTSFLGLTDTFSTYADLDGFTLKISGNSIVAVEVATALEGVQDIRFGPRIGITPVISGNIYHYLPSAGHVPDGITRYMNNVGTINEFVFYQRPIEVKRNDVWGGI